jgi:thiamine-phosphate pyrophosphorylase
LPEGFFLHSHTNAVYRVLDANCNRLREALRVIEEYFRFLSNTETTAIELKQLRHSLVAIETDLGAATLLANRDTATDCFAGRNRPEEMVRSSAADLLRANFKRAEEAARVIEEYAKLEHAPSVSERAKKIRFALYLLEQRTCRDKTDG